MSIASGYEVKKRQTLAQLIAENNAGKKRNKYGAKRTEADGMMFDSKAEARAYGNLKLLQRAGEICDLEIHPRWTFSHNGVEIGRYTADFAFTETATKKRRIVDVKSPATARARDVTLRRNLLRAFYGLSVEVWTDRASDPLRRAA